MLCIVKTTRCRGFGTIRPWEIRDNMSKCIWYPIEYIEHTSICQIVCSIRWQRLCGCSALWRQLNTEHSEPFDHGKSGTIAPRAYDLLLNISNDEHISICQIVCSIRWQ